MGSVVGVGSGADVRGGRWFWPKDTWTRHPLVIGAPGGGKTETVLRIADGFAGCVFNGLPAQVIYIDGKGVPLLAGQFGARMGARVGVRTTFWSSDWISGAGLTAVRERLMRVIPYATEGGGTWYRDIAGVLMEYVC